MRAKAKLRVRPDDYASNHHWNLPRSATAFACRCSKAGDAVDSSAYLGEVADTVSINRVGSRNRRPDR